MFPVFHSTGYKRVAFRYSTTLDSETVGPARRSDSVYAIDRDIAGLVLTDGGT